MWLAQGHSNHFTPLVSMLNTRKPDTQKPSVIKIIFFLPKFPFSNFWSVIISFFLKKNCICCISLLWKTAHFLTFETITVNCFSLPLRKTISSHLSCAAHPALRLGAKSRAGIPIHAQLKSLRGHCFSLKFSSPDPITFNVLRMTFEQCWRISGEITMSIRKCTEIPTPGVPPPP